MKNAKSFKFKKWLIISLIGLSIVLGRIFFFPKREREREK
ncbi:MAG: hypothetical protein MRECE_22c008 [Mycoplasmataceae bacterium CE_OT135]|nr:MAG: hypothetical protein MRECE_22c008 [Mycoplasmataceae bacterium CE_OT135]